MDKPKFTTALRRYNSTDYDDKSPGLERDIKLFKRHQRSMRENALALTWKSFSSTIDKNSSSSKDSKECLKKLSACARKLGLADHI